MKDLHIGKIRIDSFYLIVLAITGMLYHTLPEKGHDITVALVIFIAITVVDTFNNYREDSHE